MIELLSIRTRAVPTLLAGLVIALVAMLAACQTESVVTSDGRPMPRRPRPLPATPEGTIPTKMAFMVGAKPEDSNGNGYPDMISVIVYLFAPPHAPAIQADGAFEFSLYEKGRAGAAGIEPIATWLRAGPDLTRAAVRATTGHGYQFQLGLLESGGDQYPFQQADLVCRFDPATGEAPVRSNGIRTIQIGRRGIASIGSPIE